VVAVEVTPNEDAESRAGTAPGLLGELQDDAIQRDGVVAGDHALDFPQH
jgi:hypothetical protein